MLTCPACNHQFDEAAARGTACGACLAAGACGLVKCPECGYESPREPGVLQRFFAFLAGRRPAVGGSKPFGGACLDAVTLAMLRDGESAVIEKLGDIAHARKFLSLGLLPGTTVTVLKSSPAVVLRVGYSEFALDRALASTVQVRR
jgi:Fe2+ transport system protein FeoA